VAGGGKKHKLQPVVAVVFAALASTASAGQCPDAMDTARRLVLVTTPTMNSASARMQLFVRNSPGSRWASHGPAEPAVVGQAGLAWGFPFVRFRRKGRRRSSRAIGARGRIFPHRSELWFCCLRIARAYSGQGR
jgi:hypothetical protein